MKRYSTLLILCLFAFSLLHAQEEQQPNFKNHIHFNPLSALLFSNFEFQYERAITNTSTLSLALGVSPFGGLIRINGFDSPTIETNDFKLTGVRIMTEYRWYFQKSVPNRTGLYVGGYYRFKNLGNSISGTYTSTNTGTSSPIEVDIDITTNTVGALFGYKVMAGKHLFFDITIAGLGYSHIDLTITEEQPLPDEFYTDLETEIANNFNIIEGLLDDIELEGSGSGSGGGSIGLPAFRYGFRIGYAF